MHQLLGVKKEVMKCCPFPAGPTLVTPAASPDASFQDLPPLPRVAASPCPTSTRTCAWRFLFSPVMRSRIKKQTTVAPVVAEWIRGEAVSSGEQPGCGRLMESWCPSPSGSRRDEALWVVSSGESWVLPTAGVHPRGGEPTTAPASGQES